VHRRKHLSLALIFFLAALGAQAQVASNYHGLRRVIRSNVGFAHLTRGVNMYTLVALRSCVSTNDIGVLSQMLTDSDRLVRMASAYVLVDLGVEGRQAVAKQLNRTGDPAQRSVLTEALNSAASPTYQPILNYAPTAAERNRVRHCPRK
jgi:hypothetical protein